MILVLELASRCICDFRRNHAARFDDFTFLRNHFAGLCAVEVSRVTDKFHCDDSVKFGNETLERNLSEIVTMLMVKLLKY